MNVGEELFGDQPKEPAAAAAPEAKPTGGGEGAPAQVAPEPNPAAPPAAERNSDENVIPRNVSLRWRDERNSVRRENEELRRRLEALSKPQRPEDGKPSTTAPDMFADPEAYEKYTMDRVDQIVGERVQAIQVERIAERLEGSEEKWSEKLGPEKWAELNRWIAGEEDEDGNVVGGISQKAMNYFLSQRDPYGAAYKVFSDQQKAQRASSVMERLGEKDLDALIEEEVQKRLAANGQGQGGAKPAPKPDQNRAPNGQFAPQSAPQRRSAPSLAGITGSPAAAPAKPGPTSALDGLYS